MGIIFAFFFMLLGFLMIPFMKDMVTDARTNLSCVDTDLSSGNKFTCIFVGMGVPYFIIAILIFIGGMIGREL